MQRSSRLKGNNSDMAPLVALKSRTSARLRRKSAIEPMRRYMVFVLSEGSLETVGVAEITMI